MTKSELIFSEAKKYLGVKEINGPKSNPIITGWIKSAARWLNGDDSQTAWCGCFRGAIGLATGTGVPSSHYRAANWLSWGDKVKTIRDAIIGDTLVFKRPGGYHVGLFAGMDGQNILVLGGNQSNEVNISKHSTTILEGIRR